MALVPVLARMELEGIAVDKNECERQLQQLIRTQKQLQKSACVKHCAPLCNVFRTLSEMQPGENFGSSS